MKFIPPPPAPNILSNDAATPYNVSPQARNLVRNFRLIGVIPWLQEATFDQVVELWWYAQSTKAGKP